MLYYWVAIAGCALTVPSYRALPRPHHDNRAFGRLTLSHHAPTGVSAYAIDPTATEGGIYLLYDGCAGVTMSDEPQLLEVNLVRSNGSPALTGQYLVDMLPQPASFRFRNTSMLPLRGVE